MNQTACAPKKILIVDDDLVIQDSLTMVLRSGGHITATAKDGPETLVCVRNEKPDLIFLDLVFPLDPENVCGPLQDGFFIIEWLRQTPGAQKIPIVIISSTDPATYQSRAAAAGVMACMQKPLKRGEILEMVENIFAANG